MIKASKHPFFTFVASGVIAAVLIGGAFVTVSEVQHSQDTATKAYTGFVPLEPKDNPLVCGRTCRVDSECGAGGYCLVAPKPTCMPGKMCAATVTIGTCRAAACSSDTKCSCATNVITAQTPRATMNPRGTMVPRRAY